MGQVTLRAALGLGLGAPEEAVALKVEGAWAPGREEQEGPTEEQLLWLLRQWRSQGLQQRASEGQQAKVVAQAEAAAPDRGQPSLPAWRRRKNTAPWPALPPSQIGEPSTFGCDHCMRCRSSRAISVREQPGPKPP